MIRVIPGPAALGLPGPWVRGQGIVEYGLILALTVAITAVILGVFGGTMAEFLAAVGGAIDAATGGS